MGHFFGVGMRAFLTARASRMASRGHRDWPFNIALAWTVMAIVFAYAFYVRA